VTERFLPRIVMIDAPHGPYVKETSPVLDATYTYWPFLLGPDTGCDQPVEFKYFFGSEKPGLSLTDLPEADAYFIIMQHNNSSRIWKHLRKQFPNAKVCAFHGLHHYEAIEQRGTFYPEELAFCEGADAILCARRSDVAMWRTIFPEKKIFWLPVPFPIDMTSNLSASEYNGTLRVGFLLFSSCQASFLTAVAIHSRLGNEAEFLFLNVPKTYMRGKETDSGEAKYKILSYSLPDSWTSILPFRHTCVSRWLPYRVFLEQLSHCHMMVFAENQGHQGRLLMDCAALGIPCVCSDMTDMSDLLWPAFRCGPIQILGRAVEVAERIVREDNTIREAIKKSKTSLDGNFGPKPSRDRMLCILRDLGVSP